MHVASRIAVVIALVACVVSALVLGPENGARAASSPTGSPSSSSSPSTSQLNAQFAAAKDGATVTLKGTYSLNGYVVLPRSRNVTVNASQATFTGQATLVGVNLTGLHWKGGKFSGTGKKHLGFTMLHVRDSTFQDITFARAVPFGFHAFDLLGCSDLVLRRLTVIGYGKSASLRGLNDHDQYAEAIQTDQATTSGAGAGKLVSIMKDAGGTFDGDASHDVAVVDSRFLPSYGKDGALTSWAQSPMGQHSYATNDQNANISFVGNTVTDPLPVTDTKNHASEGALHFVSVSGLTIEDNDFASSVAARRRTWIQLANGSNTANPGNGRGNQPSSDITITGNTFEGVPPTGSYVLLNSNTNPNPRFAISSVTITGNTDFAGKSAPGWLTTSGSKQQFSAIDQSGNDSLTGSLSQSMVEPRAFRNDRSFLTLVARFSAEASRS